MPSLSLRVNAPSSRFSSTVISAKMRRPSGTCESPMRTISCAPVPAMFFPSNSMLPLFGVISPEIVRRVVDLPAPFAPMRVTISPA